MRCCKRIKLKADVIVSRQYLSACIHFEHILTIIRRHIATSFHPLETINYSSIYHIKYITPIETWLGALKISEI